MTPRALEPCQPLYPALCYCGNMEGHMHYSGILVTTSPRHFSECLLHLNRMEGVEVYHQEPDRCRVVVVQEGKTTRAQEAGFKRIAALPPRSRRRARIQFPRYQRNTPTLTPYAEPQ